MTSSLLSKQGDNKDTDETTNIKTNAPYKLIHTKNYNECDFLINLLSEQCTLGAGFAIKSPTQVIKAPPKVEHSCEDISIILARCILDGHDCNANLYKFKVLCKGDINAKL